MKPSAVFFIAVDLLRSLGKRFPSSASFSPASGMWAATYTNPATDGSVSGCFVPTLYDFLCECRVQVHRCTDAGRLCAALHLHRDGDDHASAVRPKGACAWFV